MKFVQATLLGSFLLVSNAFASTVAVIDSGVDMLHSAIAPQAWLNTGEVRRNRTDDDGNGYVDDIHGWNFAENNNLVIDYAYLNTFSEDPYRFFEIQLKMFNGTASAEDEAWLKQKRGDQEFMKEMAKFGNFVHGTHVANIALSHPKSKVLAVKLIPTEIKLPFPFGNWVASEGQENLRLYLVKAGLALLGSQQGKLLGQIGEYVGGHKALVANGSFGTGINQAKMIAGPAFKLGMGRDATEEELVDVAKHFLNAVVKSSEAMVDAAQGTLFVFAAGNDANNNDLIPTSPANIQAPNSITVAATQGRGKLASFSSFGNDTVHVAAPGVGIESAIPGNEFLKMSGTSQAAPFVAGIAAGIRAENPHLSPAQVKMILMNTVDKKNYLKGKVLSSGVVNSDRALFAAKESMKKPLHVAIRMAQQNVADIIDQYPYEYAEYGMAKETVLPLPSSFAIPNL